MKDEEADKLKAKYLDESHFDQLIDFDCDGYDVYGNLLFKFRKNRFPLDKLELGYESFKKSIIKTTGRGIAAGGYKLRERKDGSVGKFRSADEVTTGCVGFLDPRVNPEDNYCRMTNFGREYFEEYQAGVPFVQEELTSNTVSLFHMLGEGRKTLQKLPTKIMLFLILPSLP